MPSIRGRPWSHLRLWADRMTEASQTQTSPLIEVRNLSVRFAGAEPGVYAARNVSFDIKKGETVALVGESGLG